MLSIKKEIGVLNDLRIACRVASKKKIKAKMSSLPEKNYYLTKTKCLFTIVY